jgi:S1-C subfamily serine protease
MNNPRRAGAVTTLGKSLRGLFLLALAAPPTHAGMGVDDLVSWARPKVVLVYVQPDGPSRWGTGFVAARGRVITNQHVIRDARAITIWANGTPYRARVAVVDRSHDLAVLVLPTALELKPLVLANQGRGRSGEPVVILASRVQRGPGPAAVQVWPVSGTSWDYTWLRWPNGLMDQDLRLRARAELGDSGSPVLRLSDGAVVGIIRGRTNPDGTGRSDTAWAVPVEAALSLLARVHAPLEPTSEDRYYLETFAHPD